MSYSSPGGAVPLPGAMALTDDDGRAGLDEASATDHILAINSSQNGWLVPRRSWSIQDAKNRFSEVVEAARHKPQAVTKHGKPAVVVVSADEYERLKNLARAQAPSFSKLLLAMPQDGGEFPRREVHPRDIEF